MGRRDGSPRIRWWWWGGGQLWRCLTASWPGDRGPQGNRAARVGAVGRGRGRGDATHITLPPWGGDFQESWAKYHCDRYSVTKKWLNECQEALEPTSYTSLAREIVNLGATDQIKSSNLVCWGENSWQVVVRTGTNSGIELTYLSTHRKTASLIRIAIPQPSKIR